MKHLVLAWMFLVLWSNISCAKTTGLSRVELDAYSILAGKYPNGFIPERDVKEIVAELRAIRASAPEMANVHASGMTNFQELLGSLRGITPASLSAEDKELMFRRILSKPLSTDIPKLDELNSEFGVDEIRALLPFGAFESLAESLKKFPERARRAPAPPPGYDGLWNSLIVHFRKPLDIKSVAAIYTKELGCAVDAPVGIGDGDHIERTQKDGEPIHYLFDIGSGDCPSGCVSHVLRKFNLFPGEKGFRVENLRKTC